VTKNNIKLLSDSLKAPAIAGLIAGIGLLIGIAAMMNQAVPAKLFPPQTVKFTQENPEYKGLVFDRVTGLTNNTQMFIKNTPGLAALDSRVYVAWKEDRVDPGPDILFRTSKDSGNTFSDPIRLSNRGSPLFSPQIAAIETFVYVTWEGIVPVDNSYNFQVFLRVSNDYGATFGETINISESAGEAREPQIAAEGKNVYIVWQDNTLGNNDIFLRTSSDHGHTFGKPVNISNSSRDSNSPHLTISDEQLFILWSDQSYGNSDILLARITTEEPFSANIINISRDKALSTNPQLALTGQHVYVIWESQEVTASTMGVPIRDIMFRSSNDRGVSFAPPLRLSTNVIDSMEPDVAAAGEDVYVVWASSNANGFLNIFFRKSVDGGESFDRTLNLQNDLTQHMSPKIVESRQIVYVTWDNAGTADNQSFVIIYDSANIFVNNVTFESEPKLILSSRTAVTEDDIYLAWDVDDDIYFAAAKI